MIVWLTFVGRGERQPHNHTRRTKFFNIHPAVQRVRSWLQRLFLVTECYLKYRAHVMRRGCGWGNGDNRG